MLSVILFLIGDLCVQRATTLPFGMVVASLLLFLMILSLCIKEYPHYLYFLLITMLGAVWSAWYAAMILSFVLPTAMEGKPMTVTGYIASLPSKDQWQTHFLFKIEGALVRLSWRDPQKQIRVGDRWQLKVKLKRIHGTQNPGAFDYEAWALEKGIRATGYIISSTENKLLSHAWYRYPIDHYRQTLQDTIRAHSLGLKTTPWLMALMIGEHEGATHEDWRILRQTGTNHLMSIAGLHIGLLAGFVHSLCAFIWRRVPRLVLFFPAHLAGAAAAWIAAIIYSALAGFSIPTERACLMLSVFILAMLLRRQMNPWRVWSLAMLLVLMLNPLSVLTDSFWLSFGTLGLIIYGMSGRLHPSGWWWKHGRVQWVIGIGLIPLSLLLFQECSLISFIANSIAIPWLGVLVLPFCLLAALAFSFSPFIGGVMLYIADKTLLGLWVVLSWFSHLPLLTWHHAVPNAAIMVVTSVGFILFLLPAGCPGRWFGIVWMLPLLICKPEVPLTGDVSMTLLDVGQGLSVVVQTHHHLLIFDAGPKYSDNLDMGESVVLPFLNTIGVNEIDMLVISHGDNDHIGGAASLLAAMSTRAIKTSVPNMLPTPVTTACTAGETWVWDRVRFTFLHPAANRLNLDNDSSCVLRVDIGNKRILLTGDIEKLAENDLLSHDLNQLASTILVAPHHGSKTSGMRAFIHAVHPRFVLYAIGYRNRYHFPHPSVVESYNDIGAIQLDTATSGAITFKLRADMPISEPQLYRLIHKRYWFD